MAYSENKELAGVRPSQTIVIFFGATVNAGREFGVCRRKDEIWAWSVGLEAGLHNKGFRSKYRKRFNDALHEVGNSMRVGMVVAGWQHSLVAG